MHHLSIFRVFNSSEEGLNVALSLCECVDEFFIITDDETDYMRISTISMQTDIGL